MTLSLNTVIKELHALACSMAFNNSAVYPYAGGLVPMVIFFSSTYLLKLCAETYLLTWSTHGLISNMSGICSKRTKKLSLGLSDTQIRPDEHNIVAYLVSDLISLDIGTIDTASNGLIGNLDRVM